MHPFKKVCKHVQFEIDQKWLYGEEEHIACGGLCWKCSGKLSKFEHVHTDLKRIGMDDAVRQRTKGDPEFAERILKRFNQKMYQCVDCMKKRLDEIERRNEWVSLKDIIADHKNPDGKWRQEDLDRIAEVEACGPDCPWWDRLDSWRQRVNDRRQL